MLPVPRLEGRPGTAPPYPAKARSSIFPGASSIKIPTLPETDALLSPRSQTTYSNCLTNSTDML
jgi:hypothetical protein